MLLLAVLIALIPAVRVQARVVGEVVQAGFRTRGGTGCRSGCWLPVLVELRIEGRETFSGRLRLEQPDTDGDRCAVELPVTLTPGGDVARQFWMYCPVNLSESDPDISVRLLDDAGYVQALYLPDGDLVDRLKIGYFPEDVDTERTFVLDISAKALSGLAELDASNEEQFINPPSVATCPPRNVPDRWYGLEMVDVVVWDAPDPSIMTADQMEAIREWVRRGGTLVVSAGLTARSANVGGFADLLPAEVTGTRQIENPQTLQRLIGAEVSRRLRVPIVAANLRPRAGARVQLYQRAAGDEKEAESLPMVVRGRFGFGHVVMVGADLSDLCGIRNADRVALFSELLLLRSRPGKQGGGAFGLLQTRDLFPEVRSAVDFNPLAGVYLLIAFVFIVGYILLSTLATWRFLQKRGWKHHNWSAFAIAVLAGSAISVAAVQSLRGVGYRGAQLTVVDAEAGSYAAKAQCYFGVKTATHTSLDLWLPSRPGFDDPENASECKLKPIPPARAYMPSSFSDPHRYFALPERSRLNDVLVRATLKQFEGRWLGNLDGELTARITLDRARQVTNNSWLANDLGFDLHRCYLLIAQLDPGRSLREDQAIDVYDLQTIRAGERVIRLGDQLLRLNPKTPEGDLDFGEIKLSARHNDWARRFRRLDERLMPGTSGSRDADTIADTLMLLSTMKDLAPETTYNRYGADLARSRARGLDLTDALTTDTAVLIGFTDEAGPVRLCARRAGSARSFEVIEPRTARTMYRFFIPLTRAAAESGD